MGTRITNSKSAHACELVLFWREKSNVQLFVISCLIF